ncbi:MAG: hypothetical protein V3T48_07770 [Vicinamibacterales bacterium]
MGRRSRPRRCRFLLDVFQTSSSDGGLTFLADIQINDVAFDPDPGAPIRFPGPPATTRIGEYNGVAVGGCTANAVWCGNRFDQNNNPIGQQTIYDSDPCECDVVAPVVICPPDVTITCGDSTDPGDTGMAAATDNCDPAPLIDFVDVVIPTSCPADPIQEVIERTWTATDRCDQSDSCVQTITVLKLVQTLIIQQGACPTPLNRNSRGVFPVLLVGESDFDVQDVVLSTVRLSRCDCVGGSVPPSDGPPGPPVKFEDLNHPNDDDVGCGPGQVPCACNDDQSSDGITDLWMKFRTNELVEMLELDDLAQGDIVVLSLSGELTDGCQFVAHDCVLIIR